MKKSIFITGIAGSGKSTISRALLALGYKSYDIEDDMYGLFMMVRKDTGEEYVDYDNADMEKVNNARWVCDTKKLKKLIENQTENMAFYCGITSDNLELIPLFDTSILLRVNSKILNQRLLSREGTDDYGNTEAGRQRVLSGKDEFENKMIKAGMIVIDANSYAKKVAEEIIKITR